MGLSFSTSNLGTYKDDYGVSVTISYLPEAKCQPYFVYKCYDTSVGLGDMTHICPINTFSCSSKTSSNYYHEHVFQIDEQRCILHLRKEKMW